MTDFKPLSATSARSRSGVAFPPARWVFSNAHRLLMFGLGSGLLRPASGTWGTLAAWLLWMLGSVLFGPGWGLGWRLGWDLGWGLGLFLLLAFLYGCWACGKVSRELGVDDHVGIVWDEIVCFWLVLWLAPHTWRAQVAAFLLFRVFDAAKPFPIRYFDQRLKSGFGIMFDDLLAAIYTLLAIGVLSWMF